MATTTNASGTAVARAIFDAFNAHDVDAMSGHWAEGVSDRFPDGTFVGADAVRAQMQALFAALPDARMDVKAVVEQGDDVFVRWTLTATHSGAAFQGIRPTGKTVVLDGVDHMTLRDGKMAANFIVFDRMQYGQQLGLVPPDGSRPDRAMKAMFNARTAVKARLAARRR